MKSILEPNNNRLKKGGWLVQIQKGTRLDARETGERRETR